MPLPVIFSSATRKSLSHFPHRISILRCLQSATTHVSYYLTITLNGPTLYMQTRTTIRYPNYMIVAQCHLTLIIVIYFLKIIYHSHLFFFSITAIRSTLFPVRNAVLLGSPFRQIDLPAALGAKWPERIALPNCFFSANQTFYCFALHSVHSRLDTHPPALPEFKRMPSRSTRTC